MLMSKNVNNDVSKDSLIKNGKLFFYCANYPANTKQHFLACIKKPWQEQKKKPVAIVERVCLTKAL